MPTGYILPKLKNQQDFEALCRDVLNVKYKDFKGQRVEFELYGKNGEKQQGIDIKSVHKTSDGKFITAQCKNYLGENDKEALKQFRQKVTADAESVTHLVFGDVPAEVSTFLVMTALNRTTRLQDFIAFLDEDHEDQFKTEAMFWEDISDLVVESSYLMEKYYPFLIKQDNDSSLPKLAGDTSHYRASWTHELFLEKKGGNPKRLCDMHQLPNYQLPVYPKTDRKSGKGANSTFSDTEEEKKLTYSEEKTDIDQLLSKYIGAKQLCVIFGLPGIGKSTLFTWMLNQEKIGDILIDIKKIFLFRFIDLESLLKEQKDADAMAGALTDYFTEKIGSLEEKIILLDGFDEISCVDGVRAELMKKLQQKMNGICTCMITCRQNYIPDLNSIRDIPWLRLRPFTVEQIGTYIECYQKLPLSEQNQTSNLSVLDQAMNLSALNHTAQLSRQLQELLCTEENRDVFGLPVVLYMTLAVLAEREAIDFHGKITRYDIYKEIFSLENGIYDRMQNIDPDTNITSNWGAEHKTGSKNSQAEKLDKVSAELAVWMFAHGRDACPRIEAQKILTNNGLSGVEGLGDGFFELNYLETAGKAYNWKEVRFVHRSIYEYFTAKTIADEINSLALCKTQEELDAKIVPVRKKLGRMLLVESLSSEKEICEYLQDNLRPDCLEPFTRCFEEMLVHGMIDAEDQDAFYSDDFFHSMSFWERRDKEQNCFWNMLALLQITRECKGENAIIPFNPEKPDGWIHRMVVEKAFYDYLGLRGRELYLKPDKSQLLNHMDLHGCCLDNMNLSGYDLSESDTTDCSFRGSDLAGTHLNITAEDWKSDRFAGANLLMKNDAAEDILQRANTLIYPGHLIEFGHDPKTQEPVLWRVLDIQDGAALLLSEKALRWKKYHSSQKRITWAKSSLRKWLDGNFYESWFSEEEKLKIVSRSVLTKPILSSDIPEYEARENTVESRIFLLSVQEVIRYFGTPGYEYQKHKGDSIINLEGLQATAYPLESETRDIDLALNGDLKGVHWWLRSPGISGSMAAYVGSIGFVCQYGTSASNDIIWVRPALWLKL